MTMNNSEFKPGDRVIVSATQTGFGEDVHGVVYDVEVFARNTFVTVVFDKPLPDGSACSVISNLGLITHEKEITEKRFPELSVSEEQQIREVCETIPTLDGFLIIGKRRNPDRNTFFASMTFDTPVDVANAVLNLMIGSPQLALPIALAVDKFQQLSTPDK